MSFFGGVLGGGIFKAGEHIENYENIKQSAAAKKLSNNDMSHLIASIAEFGVDKIEAEINKQLDKGGLLSDKLSTEVDESSTKDNIVYKVAETPEKSQREIVRTNLIGFIKGVDAFLTRANLDLTRDGVIEAALGKK